MKMKIGLIALIWGIVIFSLGIVQYWYGTSYSVAFLSALFFIFGSVSIWIMGDTK